MGSNWLYGSIGSDNGLAVQDEQVLVFFKERFQLSELPQCWQMLENTNILLCYLKYIQHSKTANLTQKQLEMYGWVLNIVATDALVLKHQATSIPNAD